VSLNQSCPREALMFLSGGLAAAVLEKKGGVIVPALAVGF
jgi:hypothetical protein